MNSIKPSMCSINYFVQCWGSDRARLQCAAGVAGLSRRLHLGRRHAAPFLCAESTGL